MTPTNPKGTYLRVAESLRGVIRIGGYQTSLPTMSELEDLYGVSRSVVNNALNLLKKEGLVEVVPGVAWYVTGTKNTRPTAERLTEILRSGEFKIGDRFPSEAQLCKRLTVSRPAVRKGLAHLEGQGLLTVVKGTGRTVRALPPHQK